MKPNDPRNPVPEPERPPASPDPSPLRETLEDLYGCGHCAGINLEQAEARILAITAPGRDVDQAEAIAAGDDLDGLELAAWSWEPEVRLLGNVRAQTIRALCAELTRYRSGQAVDPLRAAAYRLVDELAEHFAKLSSLAANGDSAAIMAAIGTEEAPNLAKAIINAARRAGEATATARKDADA